MRSEEVIDKEGYPYPLFFTHHLVELLNNLFRAPPRATTDRAFVTAATAATAAPADVGSAAAASDTAAECSWHEGPVLFVGVEDLFAPALR